MLSRKQLLLVALGVAAMIAIIVGAVVGTQQAQTSRLNGSNQPASLELCSGEPCTVPEACRSKYGFCGIGEAWCNDDSTWKPLGCTVTVPPGGVGCTGQPCQDMTLCRSQWGYCGTGPDYCNDKSVWNPEGCGASAPTPASVTNAPTVPPQEQSSLCTGEACAAGQCRSEWGYCGTSPAYCNSKSTYTPACPGGATNSPVAISTSAPTTRTPTQTPTSKTPTLAGVTPAPVAPTPNPTSQTKSPTVPGTRTPTSPTVPEVSGSLLAIVRARKSQINSILLQSMTPTNTYVPSKVYKAEDLEAGIRTAINGIAGMNFISEGVKGKINLAAFLAQSMKETIAYDVCDENNWDLIGGVYPASNACGQLGQQYTEYHCSAAEKMMECPIDLTMEKKAATNAQWYGAPAPLFCAPKSKVPQSPGWNFGAECNQPWLDPPKLCTEYPGQRAGAFDFSRAYPNMAGRTDVEGCCWWGRGVIQLTGPCNVGKLNYFLGKGARDRGVVDAPFPDVDFCKEPDAICASTKYPELKWVSGFFYWMRDVQAGDFSGWNYQNELTKLAADPENANLRRQFINGVSGIVNRGSPFAGNVDGGAERASNFEKAWAVLGPEALSIEEGGTGLVIIPPFDEDLGEEGNNNNNNMDMGATAGGIAGGVVGAALLATAFVAVIRRRRSSSSTSSSVAGNNKQMSAANPMFAEIDNNKA